MIMFDKTINKIKNGYHHNKLFSINKFHKNELILIKFFIKIGVIKNVFLKNNKFLLKYSYSNKKKKFLILNMYKPSIKRTIKIHTLKKLTIKKNWFLLLSTNRGILSSVEASRLNVGGVIIAKLWN